MPIPAAVIFDMDGVLIDSEPIHVQIEKNLFLRLGIEVSDAVHRSYMGASNEFMYSDLRSRFKLSETIKQLIERDELYRSDYFKGLDSIALNKGIIHLINDIKAAGLKMAVATSSSAKIADILLNKCGIVSLFDAIVTTEEAGKSKPSPEVYLLAAQRLGVSPCDCIVFEDSPNGLKAAQSAGMFCVVIQSDLQILQELTKADFFINSFCQITVGQLFSLFAFKQSRRLKKDPNSK
jgi:HAD superfamily hydrolase (TIGR01509 family)